MTPAELSKLWDDLDWASRHGPTHPHPPGSSLLEPAGPATAASAGGTAAHVLQPLEGMLDRARDSISPLVGPTKVWLNELRF